MKQYITVLYLSVISHGPFYLREVSGINVGSVYAKLRHYQSKLPVCSCVVIEKTEVNKVRELVYTYI